MNPGAMIGAMLGALSSSLSTVSWIQNVLLRSVWGIKCLKAVGTHPEQLPPEFPYVYAHAMHEYGE